MKKVALLLSICIITLSNVSHAQDKKGKSKNKEVAQQPLQPAQLQAITGPYKVPFNDQVLNNIAHENAVCDSLIGISKIPFNDGLRVVKFLDQITATFGYYRNEYLKAKSDSTAKK